MAERATLTVESGALVDMPAAMAWALDTVDRYFRHDSYQPSDLSVRLDQTVYARTEEGVTYAWKAVVTGRVQDPSIGSSEVMKGVGE